MTHTFRDAIVRSRAVWVRLIRTDSRAQESTERVRVEPDEERVCSARFDMVGPGTWEVRWYATSTGASVIRVVTFSVY
jgi:hypothetical protein